MSEGCGPSCSDGTGAGPFSEGEALVRFVSTVHGGGLVKAEIQSGPLSVTCGGCGAPFTMATYVAECPECGRVHGVSPPRATDAANVQCAGPDFKLPK